KKGAILIDEPKADQYFDFLETQFSPLVNHLCHDVPEEMAEKCSPLAIALPAITIPGLQHAKKGQAKLLIQLLAIVSEAYGDFSLERRGRPKGSYDFDVRQAAIRTLNQITSDDRRLRIPSKKEE